MLAGLLLAGGTSSRFGSDKALAEVEGRTLLSVAEACLREVCTGPLLVASGDGVARPGVGDGQVADLEPDAGPLSAIAGGLTALSSVSGVDAVAVLAVDHLHPSAALLRLLAAARGDAVCALAEVEGRRQPLHAVWSVEVAEAVAETVVAGERSVLGWLGARQDVVVLGDLDLARAGIAPDVVRDVDRPGDLPG